MKYCERIKLEEEPKGVGSVHLVRYQFARQFCTNKIVLDSACGTGYGSTLLHDVARHVIGIDIDPESISYAEEHYPFPNIQFMVMNSEELAFSSNSFDVVCSFETVEHVSDADGFLNELVRVLRPDGICLISAPNPHWTTLTPKNPHHVQEWNRSDFDRYLKRFFGHVDIMSLNRRQSILHKWIQILDPFQLRGLLSAQLRSKMSRQIGTTAFHEMEVKKDLFIGPYAKEGLSIMAVCCHPKKGSIPSIIAEDMRLGKPKQ